MQIEISESKKRDRTLNGKMGSAFCCCCGSQCIPDSGALNG